MDNTNHKRSWNVLNWNVRGLNGDGKCEAVKAKIEESTCSVYCIQETKKETFDHSFIKKLAPKRFDKFAYAPSIGASGGILMGWNSSIFKGEVIHCLNYAVTVKFTSKYDNSSWKLTAVYGPCQGDERINFVNWLNDLSIAENENWMLIGDFNFYRDLSDRNKPGGNMNDIFLFNSIISNLGIQEIPLKGRKYAWSNMQEDPLLEQLDWCFTSANWISSYPSTLMHPLAKPISDHIPCQVQIGTEIPKAKIFRFENFWMDIPGFIDLVQSVWNSEVRGSNAATRITAKFKLLRRAIKRWTKGMAQLSNLIKECNSVLLILDKLEEQRPLFIQERNFRIILRRHILTLLKYQKEYWKKRYTVRWTKFGDESTKFFHAAATERYRHNTITSLETEDGRQITEHFEKAALLLEAYKKRMGMTTNPIMQIDLENLIHRHNNLDHLSEPVTREEIDKTIAQMPTDKSPGPDGFNGLFFKKCWHIIKEDIYDLCNEFFAGNLDLKAINSSFITLIPKCNNPSSVNDFRPISLLNSVLKLLTKIMSDRLQRVIIPLVHQNQYGFIKNRTIQDCLAWSFEYIHQCQYSKQEIIILKLDFEKAFDTIEHSTILCMLHHLGFTSTWCNWVKRILDTGTSAILLNGTPGKEFQCKRGVRQGDPLSPLLFVIAAELLQYIVNKAHSQGIFSLPIPCSASNDFPIIQYADDTIMVMKALERELFCLKGILEGFSQSTGLRVNYQKSCLVPLNLSQEKASSLARVFGCQLGSLPFTYLGLPLGTTKPRINDFAPLMNQMERRLTATATFLGLAGKVELTKSVFSALPTYTMCTLKIPLGAVENMDRARRDCLWRGTNVNDRKKPLVAWKKVHRPKAKGGLGVINLRSQNTALLLKHLDKFYNKRDIPWVKLIWSTYYADDTIPHAAGEVGSFWWKDLLKLCDQFRGVATCTVGDGKSVLFWLDVWNNRLLKDSLPRLFSFAKNQNISVAQFLQTNTIEEQFYTPLSMEAYQEFEELQSIIQGIQVSVDRQDTWHYIWGSNKYSSKQFYNFQFRNIKPPDPFLWIWKSKCSNKLRVFCWLLLMDRLNTKNLLRRRSFHINGGNYSCVMCNENIEETAFHLFFNCNFGRACWGKIGMQWNQNLPFFRMMKTAQELNNNSFFMEIFIIACWNIWKQRNALIFEGIRPSINSWTFHFIEEAKLQSHRLKDNSREDFLNWVNSVQ